MAVTHPLWPSKEPRKRSDSDIFLLQVCLVVRQPWAHRHINSHCDLTVQYPQVGNIIKNKLILRKQCWNKKIIISSDLFIAYLLLFTCSQVISFIAINSVLCSTICGLASFWDRICQYGITKDELRVDLELPMLYNMTMVWFFSSLGTSKLWMRALQSRDHGNNFHN